MATPKKDETQGTEATGDASSFAARFPLEDIDIFAGSGTRGEEIELDEEALAKRAGLEKAGPPAAAPKQEKRRFGFG
jgi:hypothetical protein